MDIPDRLGDVLSHPARARLFALLTELRRPAPTQELAARLGAHANGVRMHLGRLHAAELVVREHDRTGRGRPRDMWAVSPHAQPGGDPPTAYADLGRWLVRVIAAGATRARDIEAAGRQIGRELAPADDASPRERRMYEVLVALGFQPRRELAPSGQLTYSLGNCPYRDAARERRPVVCSLHLGMTRGLLDVIDPHTKLAGFVGKDPDAAGCQIKVRGRLAAEVVESALRPG